MPNVLLTFEDLSAGDIVNGQYSAQGVSISTTNAGNPPMVFDTDNPTGGDYDLATSNLGNVLIISEDGDSSDPDDNAGYGTFVFEFDEPSEVINFNVLDTEEGGWVKLFDDNGSLIAELPLTVTGNNGQGVMNVGYDNVARMEVTMCGSGAIDNLCYCTPEPELDGIVEGTNAGETIDIAYTGDPDGDMVDAGDAVAGIGVGDEDIIDAFGGDDTILAGNDDDEIYAGSGNDYVEGGAGDDVIYGDSNYSGPGAGVSVRESLNWSQQGVGNGGQLNGFTQDTGNVNVTFSIEAEQGSADTQFESADQQIQGIDAGDEVINDNSSMYSVTNGDSGQAKYNVTFSDAVDNVSFRINDVDGDGFVRVRAYDQNGNQIPLTLSGGTHVSVNSGNGTISSNGGYQPDSSAAYSALVSIDGPVARIEIFHDQRGADNSGINVTDIFFDAPIVDDGEDGNDHLEGGAGDDTIFGEGGDDRLEGQAGNDALDGGDGNDIILGGGGNDTAEGGAGNDEIWMGSGDDVVNAGSGNDWVHGQTGNDVLNGEDGDDMLFGEAGDDTLTGGDGSDLIEGGDGRDTIIGGNDGDDVDGGTGGDDYDILDLRGEGDFRVVGETVDPDGDSTSGTIQFLDGDGNVTGTMQFAEIEEILGDRVNEGPSANDDDVNVEEDDSVLISPLGNDTDPENDTLSIVGFTQPSNGTVTDNGDGTFTYEPNDNYNGPDSFTYTIRDEAGNEDTATINITVAPVNDDPVANDDTATVDEDDSVIIDLLGNDTDVDGDTLSIDNIVQPDNGTVTDNGDGTVTYTPDPGYNGPDEFTYTVSDGNGGTDTATVTITVDSVNDGPTANDDTVDVDEDGSVLIAPLGNDTDPDGDTLTVDSFTQPSNGTLTDNGDGTFSYEPDPNYNGPDSFTYTVTDGNGGTSTATVNINVAPVNDAPDAVNDIDTTPEDVAITLDVLDNDTDVDGDTLTVTGATVPAEQGTVEIIGNQVVFTPAENFNGLATISYSIEDGNGGTDTAIHEVNVTPVNDAPVAVDDIAQTEEDTAVVIDLIANDFDVDGDDLTIGTVSVPPEQGTVVDNGDGTVTFTPAPNYTGPATIEYTVVDGNGGEDMGGATVNVFIEGVNDGPDAVDDAVTTDEDTPITIDALANDTDMEGDDLTITGASVPIEQGSVAVVGNELVFTPAPDFNGEATITYSITDGNGGTDTAEVVVTVTPVNDDPVAVDDVDTTDEDEPVVVDLIGNDTDVDGDPLSLGSVSVPADQGTVVDNGDGTVTFTPAPNFNGPATITYTVVDGQGGEDEGQAVVSVGAVNDGPVANDDTDTTLEDTPITVDLLANDTDDDGDALTVISATVPADQGTLVDNGDGTVTFTPAPDFNGEATITYEISDNNGGTDVGLHVITVTPDGDAPVTVDDVAETPEDTPVVIDPLANDSDPDGDTLSIAGTPTADNGTVTVNPDGTIEYTPDPDFNGTDTITYVATDPEGNETPGTITVTVTPVNDDPVAVDDVASTDEDTPVVVDLIGNDTDVDGDPLTLGSVSVPPEQGTVVDNGDGTVTFTPAPDFNGPATITYTVEDGQGGEDEGQAVVTVSSVNDGPDAVDDADTTDEDTPITVDLLANDTDPENDTLTVTSATVPADQGSLVDNGDGTVTFTPAPNFNGTATISYEISDGNGGTDTAEHVITVTPVNDDPVANDDDVVVDEDESVLISPLGNDTDVDGDTLTIDSFTQPSNGTLTDNGDGTFTYEPDPGYNGDDSFTYTVTDGNGGTDTATVNIVVNSVNDGPDAVDDNQNGTIVAPVIVNVIGNDTDPDGDALTVTDFTQPVAGGVVTDNGDGTLTFTPDGTVDGEITFDYTITDGNGGFDTATVTLLLRDGIVEGTAGDDLIDVNYMDDPEGDMIDNNDEILPGEGPQDDIVLAGDGNDTVIASDGDDEVYGEDGDDTLYGNDGDDYLSGGEGNDVLYGGDGDDHLDAGQGGDELYGEDGDDLLQGGPGPDLLDGGDGDDDIRGGNSDDVIIGGDGSDTVLGEDGDDVINTSGSAPRPDLGYPGLFPADDDPNDDIDFVDGGAGDDTISTGDDADTIIGGFGNDTIDGGIDADTIDGGEGDDRIVGGEGSDIIDGGAGDDLIYAGIDPDLGLPDNLDIPDDIDLVPNNGMDVVHGGDGNDTIFGADDDDMLFGDAGDDYIDGGIDDDTIDGGTGDDTIIGGEGADVMSGGDDADTFIVDNQEDALGDVIDGGTGGDDNDTLNLTGAGPLRIINETVDADGDSTSGTIEFLDGVGGAVIGTLDFSEIENIVPCFTPGTSIATPRGEMLVEDLQVGDKIITRDNGIQEIRWIGAKRMDGRELQNNPHLQPVLIQKGSLGNGLPERDMLVSPNHRMLVNNDRVSLYFEENEVLVSAKHLVNPTEGVQSINSMGTTYIHFMFDNHEVVLSNGAWTESFQPGDYSLKGIGNAQRNEIFELFPELQGQKGREAYASARLTLKKHEARMLFK